MGGYSARYHAASLAAVFLALAIGILIGVGFGEDVDAALEPAGATITEVAVVRRPPDVGGLSGDLEGTQHARMRRNPDAIEALGRVAGRQLVLGGGGIQRVRAQLLNRFSGRPGRAG